jgi:hypothetical protein
MLKPGVLNYVLCHGDVGSISPADRLREHKNKNLAKNYSFQVRRGLNTHLRLLESMIFYFHNFVSASFDKLLNAPDLPNQS